MVAGDDGGRERRLRSRSPWTCSDVQDRGETGTEGMRTWEVTERKARCIGSRLRGEWRTVERKI